MTQEPVHRRPLKKDFVGKTVVKFDGSADNNWVFRFADGTSFAIHSDLHHGLAVMEICESCADK